MTFPENISDEEANRYIDQYLEITKKEQERNIYIQSQNKYNIELINNLDILTFYQIIGKVDKRYKVSQLEYITSYDHLKRHVESITNKIIKEVIFGVSEHISLKYEKGGGEEFTRIHKVLAQFEDKEGYKEIGFIDGVFKKKNNEYKNELESCLNVSFDELKTIIFNYPVERFVEPISGHKVEYLPQRPEIGKRRTKGIGKRKKERFEWNKAYIDTLSWEQINHIYNYLKHRSEYHK